MMNWLPTECDTGSPQAFPPSVIFDPDPALWSDGTGYTTLASVKHKIEVLKKSPDACGFSRCCVDPDGRIEAELRSRRAEIPGEIDRCGRIQAAADTGDIVIAQSSLDESNALYEADAFLDKLLTRLLDFQRGGRP
jgi:hypothetical protein